MRKVVVQVVVLALLALAVGLSFWALRPAADTSDKKTLEEFSSQRAFQHVKRIGQKPHFVGSPEHSKVRNYIVDQLQELDLEVHTQRDYALNAYRILSMPENIITKLEGSDPQPNSDLLVLSHYDSDPHSSFGASDDGSAVAAVLESVRAFKAKHTGHKNNIILVFTDAEEIGLLGAELFANHHPWMQNIGLVLNFEARGTSGPSNTILETNHGNANLVNAFAKARPQYPMASSLMYEVYKTMPNDTDATVFREEKDLPSFFFAFIDGHYNYHSATDTPGNLDKRSLAHQGSYLMALLPYLGDHDLSGLQTGDEQVYFNVPLLNVVHYSYYWIFPLLILAWIFFVILYRYGLQKEQINLRRFFRGLLPFIGGLVLCAAIGFFGWQAVVYFYPQYREIQQGFPYNGHLYVGAFVFFGLAVLFGIYHRMYRKANAAGNLTAVIFIWLVINTALAFMFKGASFFIIPVICAEIGLGLMLKYENPNLFLRLLCGLPAVFILVPLIEFIPVALGLKVIFASLALLTLVFGVLLPIWSYYSWKNWLAFLALIVGVVFLGKAHATSDFSKNRPKPNSLVYRLNVDEQKAMWNTYDHILDSWTKHYISGEHQSGGQTTMDSKYGGQFTYSEPAEAREIPAAGISTEKDTVASVITYSITIEPQRSLNRISLFSQNAVKFRNFKANGLSAEDVGSLSTKSRQYESEKPTRLLTYYVVESTPLEIEFKLLKDEHPTLEVYESSYDLLENPWLDVPARDSTMMPRPFVLNDAIITKQRINL